MKIIKNEKGFSLVELIAIIIIIGIILMIINPVVSNVLDNSRKKTFKSNVQSLASEAIKECQTKIIENEPYVDLYVFNVMGVVPKLESKGELPTGGSIAVSPSCKVAVSVTDGVLTVIKEYDKNDYNVYDGNRSDNNLQVPFKDNVNRVEVYNSKTEVPDKTDFTDILSTEVTNAINDSNIYYGKSFGFDKDNKITAYFQNVTIMKSFDREVALDYAYKMIDSMKSYFKSQGNTGTNTYTYYITKDFIMIFFGTTNSIDDYVEELYSAYKEAPTNFTTYRIKYR